MGVDHAGNHGGAPDVSRALRLLSITPTPFGLTFITAMDLHTYTRTKASALWSSGPLELPDLISRARGFARPSLSHCLSLNVPAPSVRALPARTVLRDTNRYQLRRPL